jgi:hypothetical protein
MASKNFVVPDKEVNANMCRCPECPTYNRCMKINFEHLFCSRGNTECTLDEEGCICGECPVWKEYGIKSFYYCRSSLKI